jgi:hypothetical protein
MGSGQLVFSILCSCVLVYRRVATTGLTELRVVGSMGIFNELIKEVLVLAGIMLFDVVCQHVALLYIQFRHLRCIVKEFKLADGTPIQFECLVVEPVIDFSRTQIKMWLFQSNDDPCATVSDVTGVYGLPVEVTGCEEPVGSCEVF